MRTAAIVLGWAWIGILILTVIVGWANAGTVTLMEPLIAFLFAIPGIAAIQWGRHKLKHHPDPARESHRTPD